MAKIVNSWNECYPGHVRARDTVWRRFILHDAGRVS